MPERRSSSSKTCLCKSETPKWPWRRGRLFALLSPIILTACQTTASPETRSSFCLIAQGPIFYSRLHDSRLTIEQVQQYNATGKALCGWKGAKGKL